VGDVPHGFTLFPLSSSLLLVSTAQQDAERARFIVEKAHQDRLSIVIRAEGEARSAEMIGKAIASNPGFVQLRRIDAAKDIAHTVAKSNNTVYLSADSLLLNMLEDGACAVQGLRVWPRLCFAPAHCPAFPPFIAPSAARCLCMLVTCRHHRVSGQRQQEVML
jgi:hypothetical protein